MNYLSVCSGIEAASVAWHPLGWNCLGVSEIEPFPSAVLAHHYPNVPNFGDMTKFKEWNINGTIKLLVGGTPCQSFSVAGLRQGLKDPRGNLMLTFLAIAEHFKPKWIVWENVCGVLSSNKGKDFGCFLGGLGELGYGFAYRVLDAQWVRTHGHKRAVPQRRRRVFVVGCFGNHIDPAKVLFERQSLLRYFTPRKSTQKGIATNAKDGVGKGCASESNKKENLVYTSGSFSQFDQSNNFATLRAGGGDLGGGSESLVVNDVPINADKQTNEIEHDQLFSCWWNGANTASTLTKSNAGGAQRMPDKDNFGAVLQPAPITARESGKGYWVEDNISGTLRAEGENRPSRPSNVISEITAFQSSELRLRGTLTNQIVSPTLKSETKAGDTELKVLGQEMLVRRLTPRECERLQGFPDDFTKIPWKGKSINECPDSPRYKALGNSMAVNCMEWLGERIQAIESGKPFTNL